MRCGGKQVGGCAPILIYQEFQLSLKDRDVLIRKIRKS
jgi:hypothetical protein